MMVINLQVVCVCVRERDDGYRNPLETQQTHLLNHMTNIMEKPVVKV